jgi:hypothetical protein
VQAIDRIFQQASELWHHLRRAQQPTVQLHTYIDRAMHGMLNLIDVYANDPTTVSKMEVICQNLEMQIGVQFERETASRMSGATEPTDTRRPVPPEPYTSARACAGVDAGGGAGEDVVTPMDLSIATLHM